VQFEDLIRNIIENECEDYYLGVADLSTVENSLFQKYGLLLNEYQWSISIGITLPYLDSARLSILENKTFYHDIENQLDNITAGLIFLLQDKGYKAFAVPKIGTEGFSYIHKLAANMAGLGQIGENELLTTTEASSSVIWGTVLTNSPLV